MHRVKNIIYFRITLNVISCGKEKQETKLKTGIWRGELIVQNNQIPFNFEVLKIKEDYKINLINGDEVLEIDEVKLLGDSLFFNMHIFDISIKSSVKDSVLTGTYTKNYAKDYILPFKAVYGKENRFDNLNSTNVFDGTWETVFTNKEGKKTNAIGIFKKEQNKLKGTFLTKTGDYRFLDGYTKNDSMYLYTFDGNHIYKFSAKKENDTLIKGEYWSGKTGYKTFVSVKNENAKLPNANELTFLKEGHDKIEFSFPGLDGNPVYWN